MGEGGGVAARFTHCLLCPVHARLPDQRVVTELHLVGVNHIPTVRTSDTIVVRTSGSTVVTTTFDVTFLRQRQGR